MDKELKKMVVITGAVATFVTLILPGSINVITNRIQSIPREAKTAAIFFVQSISVDQIQNSYHNQSLQVGKKVKVLIVPGHDVNDGGTEFNDVYERDLVVDIADELARYLRQNPRYSVMVARSKTGWDSRLQSYIDTNYDAIVAFRATQAQLMAGHISSGEIEILDEQVGHPTAPTNSAIKLYGINKWASENRYDITLHVHLNDYNGRRSGRIGKYDGFAVYIPDHQYSNSEASRVIGNSIAIRLNAFHATSTLPKESAGVVEDQQLIAIGSNNSIDGTSILVEYGYIYEPQIQNDSVRPVTLKDYAYQTYLGLQDFFNDAPASAYGSTVLPYDLSRVIANIGEKGVGIYALQTTLRHLGYYPPKGRSLSDCPITGVAGDCTRVAISEYQQAHELAQIGTLGPETRASLSDDIAVTKQPVY